VFECVSFPKECLGAFMKLHLHGMRHIGWYPGIVSSARSHRGVTCKDCLLQLGHERANLSHEMETYLDDLSRTWLRGNHLIIVPMYVSSLHWCSTAAAAAAAGAAGRNVSIAWLEL